MNKKYSQRNLKCNLREQAINIKKAWGDEIKEFGKTTFELPKVTPVFLGNVRECGEVWSYNADWDKAAKLKPKDRKPLKAFEGDTFDCHVLDDPIMLDLIEKEEADIFTTDSVAAVLMCAENSNYSWDVSIQKIGEQIIIDKRQENELEDGKDNILNNTLVCETAQDSQPQDDASINGIKQLMREAQGINDAWLHVARKDADDRKLKLKEEDPFIEDEHQVATRVGYLYRIWRIQEANEITGKKEKKICIRCAVHTQLSGSAEPRRFMNTYALNEYDREPSNWRKNIGDINNVLNTEIFDNLFKVSRWVVQSLLADVEYMKLAFVSRSNMKDNSKHVLLATHQIETRKFAQYNNIALDKMWPVLRYMIDCIDDSKKLRRRKDLESGKQVNDEEEKEGDEDEDEDEENYVLLKDYLSQTIKLYKTTDDDEEEKADDDN